MAQRNKRGKLFVLEGPDGVGKTTLTQSIFQFLQESGEECELLAFPGKEPGTVGHLIYNVHHDPAAYGVHELTPESQQTLHIAAHLDAIVRRILPSLSAGRHVLLDRFWWSTWVYGRVAGINRGLLKRMIDLELAQWGVVKPSLVILLCRQAPLEREERIEHWQALSKEYAALAARESKRYPVTRLTNAGTLQQAVAGARTILQRHLPLPRPSIRRVSPDAAKQLTMRFDLNTGAPQQPALVLTHLLPAKPTAVFDTYWRFAAERQNIFFKRLLNAPCPWTDDAILSKWKFTNAYRASDRVSQYLIRHVIYRADLPTSTNEVFFRIVLFKLFNKIETWQLLEENLGPLTYAEYVFKKYDRVLSNAMRNQRAIYSAAYIMPSVGRHVRKHSNHLRLIERMMEDNLPAQLVGAPNMQRGFELLRGYPGIGHFLAYQLITDVNYSEITSFSEMDFVVPGPGALDGIRKCFADLGGLNEPEIIKMMADRQEEEFARLGLDFQNLWGRRLQLIDCQNLFCEVDKYARVAHPEITGLSGRSKIKQKFSPASESVESWYPPKWGINEAVATWSRRTNVASAP